ncbi:MAG TPA: 3-ketoacyl-ACP reductase [Acidimicrobiales bacterium]|nr:3-ketoacyl-ACP reductase [Acidimicrobiales bacterium]
MRVALVTGGTRGIGLGIALQLAAEHFSLVVCGRRPQNEVREAMKALEARGTKSLYVRADVADSAARRRLVENVRLEFGRLDVLVNNAGIAPRRRVDILSATEESFEEVILANLKGPYFLTQACAAWMIEQKAADPNWVGCIVNISSMSATVASPDRGEYCISKAGLSMATRLWASRLGEFGIPVYEVRPGVIRTDMTAPAEDKYSRLITSGLTIEKRWGTPEDVGRAVAVLVRGDLPYTTGNVVHVDGGLTVPRL